MIIVILISLAILSTCTYYKKEVLTVSPTIRILLYEGKNFSINPINYYNIKLSSNDILTNGQINVKMVSNGLLLNELLVNDNYIEIVPDLYFEFLGKKYRGTIGIHKKKDSIILINIIDIESYLYGVLPNEVYPNWNIEALKAQAIISRTYALYEMANSKKNNRLFDLYDDTRSQVYDGATKEFPSTTKAVNETIGEVLRYNGKIIPSFFHASSGGITEASEEVFGFDMEYLKPVKSDFCEIYPDNKWELVLPKEEYNEIFSKYLSNEIIDFVVKERTETKRIKYIDIIDNKSNVLTLKGLEFRKLIGNIRMRSTRANVKLSNETLYINGVGFGHGVGLGQWDAQGMALKGYNYKQILTYFYKGVSIDKLW